MLKSALRYVRQKPKMVRNQYALVLASLFTGLVAFVWFTSGSSSFDRINPNLNATEGNAPFSNLIKQAKDQFASVKSALPQNEQATSTATTTAPIVESGEMVLTAETLEGLNQTNSLASTTSTTMINPSQATTTNTVKYVEVQIATTSSATSTTTTPR